MACTERWTPIYNCPSYQTGGQLWKVCDGKYTLIRTDPCHYPQTNTCTSGNGPYGPGTYGPPTTGPCPKPVCPPFLPNC
ncbi:hypothetical protein AAH991_08520 [Microbispora sp. ZYX-F-249]|uniref:Chitin-binding type-2 domain-containing protein n=1 Tax=Microbispora maris TaxID=3144104 RepID=A0ABV0AN15_9ACTN